MVHVIVFAHVFGAFESTGILLPLLIVGDVLAIQKFGKHVDWRLVKLLFPPAIVGVVLGWALMGRLPDRAIQVLLGCIILGLTLLQIIRIWKPHWFGKTSHSTSFALASGVLAGFTTMIANAAGPVISLYLLSISTPKLQLVGTSCWFFFWLNTAKLPFSYQLGLISGESLLLNLMLAPTVAIGIAGGSFILHHIPQKLFNSLILLFTAIASLRLIGLF